MLTFGLLSAFVAAWWWSGFLALALVLCLALLAINLPVYRFFKHKRGLLFALGVIPWHWLYYFYSGLAFAIGTARYRLQQWRSLKTISTPL